MYTGLLSPLKQRFTDVSTYQVDSSDSSVGIYISLYKPDDVSDRHML